VSVLCVGPTFSDTDTCYGYSAMPRSAVGDARKRGFPLKVEVLHGPIMLSMAIRGESEKQKCSATGMLISTVTITTPLGLFGMCGVRQIIVKEEMDHPLIGRPVLDEMDFAGDRQASLGRSIEASTKARRHSRTN
jgi:hypothetical protein